MFSNTWRIFSLVMFIGIIATLVGIYYFAPDVWEVITTYAPEGPYSNYP